MTSLPSVLVELPWRTAPGPAPADDDPILVPGLEPPADRRTAWEEGERERWRAIRAYGSWGSDEWEEAAGKFRDGRMSYEPTRAGFLVQAPEHLARPLVAEWRPGAAHDFSHSLMPVIARFEQDARDAALYVARANPHGTGRALLPLLDVEVARRMADWRYRTVSGRKVGDAWLDRHGLTAVPYLVPDALAKRRVPRLKAVAALRYLAAAHGAGRVVEAARVHGDRAADAVAEVLARPYAPMPSEPAPDALPDLPRLPRWIDVEALPAPLLRDGAPLPPDAVRNLLTMLAMARRGAAFPGLAEALDGALAACAPESLPPFGWAVFEAWRAEGTPGRESWALEALGRLGDDDVVRRLRPLVEQWPGQSGHHRAVQGVGVLAAIGTDAALTALHRIAARSRYRGLRENADRMLTEVAKARGLTADQLADRLVPDFGLDADGSLVLDYGPRRFTVGFDEQLKPFVRDESGKLRKSLPKPGVKDDETLATAAYQRFAALRKDVRTVAAEQVRRLETAMVAGRRWTTAEFTAFVVEHPLLRHLARRLVWSAGGTAFRVAEDGTFADVDDDPFVLAESATVGLPHPVELGEERPAWADLFADYEITQPFPQLGRPVYAFTAEEATAARLPRFEGATVPTGRVLGLERRGWRRGAPQDNGIQHWTWRALPTGAVAVVGLDPGVAMGAIDVFPEQRTTAVWIGDRPDWSPVPGTARFGDLDAVTAAELLADLVELTAVDR
ncbi:DUF4132 domain-containing protein [Actinomadura kijaniata]|uniref:DUF4132 domain-containing protein n=1 Tax=Actinomadura kijaniata TaxID=46161 RepID=UPI00082F65F1|nr:DUF4132 domain-containing protein [Actinomadura kijaniata]